MPLHIDMHLHTSRYSKCSKMDATCLIRQAVKVGLDGVVITEHHHIWDDEELAALKKDAGEPGFLLLAAFEYTSAKGDLLVYGLESEQEKAFKPGDPPEEVVERIHKAGGVCIAAHPTREGLGFDERIIGMPLEGIEVQSVNLETHEQRLAYNLAKQLGVPPTASSDAHRIEDVGRYATEFYDPIQSMEDLKETLKKGRFRPVGTKT